MRKRTGIVMLLLCILFSVLFTGVDGGVSIARAGQAGAANAQKLRVEALQLQQQKYLAEGWAHFYQGRYRLALRRTGGLLRSGNEAVRVEAKHLAARALWAGGDVKGREKAQAIWKHLAKESTLNSNLKRIQIGKALDFIRRKDLGMAGDTLELVLRSRIPSTCTAEAAILFAEVKAMEGDRVSAEKACAFAIEQLQSLTDGREALSGEVVSPFLLAARRYQKQYEVSPAHVVFDEAEALRQSKKYGQANRVYRRIMKEYSDTDFAPRSEYSIGLSLRDGGQVPQALKYWHAFVKADPTGPWRGQAYLAQMDLYLGQAVNISRAVELANRALEGLPAALKDDKARESWSLVEVDLHLRAGLLSYVGGNPKEALPSLRAARDAASRFKETTRQGLDRLLAVAHAEQPLLPEDVYRPQAAAKRSNRAGSEEKKAKARDRIELQLGMATVYNLMGRPAQGLELFQRVLKRSRRITQARKSYALFGCGVALQETNQSEKADRQFIASLRTYRRGSWHDETLYRLARLEMHKAGQELARIEQIHLSLRQKNRGKPAKTLSLSPKDKAGIATCQQKAQRHRRTAMTYLSELAKRYPESSHIAIARYHAALLPLEAGEFDTARNALQIFVSLHPKSIWSGDAYVRLINLQLEHDYDIAAARATTETAVQWARQKKALLLPKPNVVPPSGVTGKKASGDPKSTNSAIASKSSPIKKKDGHAENKGASSSKKALSQTTSSPNVDSDKKKQASLVPLWVAKPLPPAKTDLRRVIYEIFLRAGTIAYLDQKYDTAIALLNEGRPFLPSRGYVYVSGESPSAMDNLISLAKQRMKLTPPSVIEEDTKERLILQIADAFYVQHAFERSLKLYGYVADRTKGKTASSIQRSWAVFKRGRCHYMLGWDGEGVALALEDYLTSYKLARESAWASKCLFLAGNIVFNNQKDEDEAVRLWRKVIHEFPDSRDCIRAEYYIGVAYEWQNRLEDAKLAYHTLLKNHPNSPYASIVRNHHLRNLETLENQKGSKSNRIIYSATRTEP